MTEGGTRLTIARQTGHFSSPFGPIAPPSFSARRKIGTQPSTSMPARNPYIDNNPWNALQNDHGNDDGEDDARLG